MQKRRHGRLKPAGDCVKIWPGLPGRPAVNLDGVAKDRDGSSSSRPVAIKPGRLLRPSPARMVPPRPRQTALAAGFAGFCGRPLVRGPNSMGGSAAFAGDFALFLRIHDSESS
jgi:hypothetical protein